MRLRPARGLGKGWQEAAPIVRYTQIHPRNGQEACNEFSEEEARGLEHWASGTDRPGRASGAVGIQRALSCFREVKNLQPGPGYLCSSSSPAIPDPHNSMTRFL